MSQIVLEEYDLEELLQDLEVNPTDPEVYFRLGMCYQLDDSPDEALAYYNKAVEMNPEHSHALNNIAVIYKDTKEDPQAAVGYLERAMSFDPNFIFVYHNMAMCYKEMKQYDKVIPNLKKALDLDPNYPESLYYLGLFYHDRLMQIDVAIDTFEKLMQIDPTHYEGIIELAECYYEAHHIEKAFDVVKACLEILPDEMDLIDELASLYSRSGDYEKALDMYNNIGDADSVLAQIRIYSDFLIAPEKVTECENLLFELDPEKFDIYIEVKRAQQDGRCTLKATGKEFFSQKWYSCRTCCDNIEEGICVTCSRVCHEGHDVVEKKFSLCYCDCGSSDSCKSCN